MYVSFRFCASSVYLCESASVGVRSSNFGCSRMFLYCPLWSPVSLPEPTQSRVTAGCQNNAGTWNSMQLADCVWGFSLSFFLFKLNCSHDSQEENMHENVCMW